MELVSNEEEIELVVNDNGVGFDTSKSSSGFGLTGMSERTLLAGGVLTVSSELNKGTLVRVTMKRSLT